MCDQGDGRGRVGGAGQAEALRADAVTLPPSWGRGAAAEAAPRPLRAKAESPAGGRLRAGGGLRNSSAAPSPPQRPRA